MIKQSGSTSWPALECAASTVLPWVSETTEEAELGTQKHHYVAFPTKENLEAIDKGERDETIALHDAIKERIVGFGSELAFVVNLKTFGVRLVGRNLGRDYGQLFPDEIGVTLDFDNPALATFIELKTGYGDVAFPKDNPQIWLQAYVFAIYFKLPGVTGILFHKKPGQRPIVVSHFWSTFDLLDIADLFRDGRRRAESAEEQYQLGRPLSYNVGPHCKYCNAWLNCPAQVGLLQRALAATAGGTELSLNGENAFRAHEQVALVEKWVKKAKAQLTNFSFKTPIVWPDGSVYGPHLVKETDLDASKVWEVLEPYGLDIARLGVEFSATKASLDRAVKAIAEFMGVTQKSIRDEIVGKLKANEGWVDGEKQKVSKYMPDGVKSVEAES